ncbi:MAG: FAD-dependent oxidoreductase [Pseudomonadota bacterium]
MSVDRRRLIAGAAAAGGLGLAGCATTSPAPTVGASAYTGLRLAPIRAEIERITRITVCLRPFRKAGPRLEVESVGDKRVVHNYGHGGSGWSLSWGAGEIATRLALETGERDIAVIGCGALGLTTATVLQQAGAHVTIYARERMFEARSARATGVWSPDSRIAAADAMPAGFPEQWEAMARTSWRKFHTYLGLAGAPVEWADRYALYDPEGKAPEFTPSRTVPVMDEIQFARLSSRLRDLQGRSKPLAEGSLRSRWKGSRAAPSCSSTSPPTRACWPRTFCCPAAGSRRGPSTPPPSWPACARR